MYIELKKYKSKSYDTNIPIYQLYTTYIPPTHMKHYNKKFIKKYITQLEKDGFSCIDNGKRITIKRELDKPMYILHVGPNSFHPLRLFLKNNFEYEL